MPIVFRPLNLPILARNLRRSATPTACRLWACLLLVLVFFIAGHGASAQVGTTGTVTGAIVDPSKGLIVGAVVTATDTQKGVVFRGATNKSGLYRLTMPIGNYSLQVDALGFDTIVQKPFELELGQTDRFDFQMKIGSDKEVVEVTASDTPLLKKDDGTLSTVIDEKTVDDLPLATRNYVQLTLLVPGATSPDPAGMTSVRPTSTAGRPFINGNNEQSDNFLLDGLENNQLSDNLIAYTPSADAIKEFTVITQNPSAAYGNFKGGTISASIKSGSNEFHGRLFEFIRNDALNAGPWAAGNNNTVTKTKIRWNMFGGAIGGPIVKQKLFFFGDYQGQRYDIPSQSQSATILTAKMQTGDFSELLPGSGAFSDTPAITLGDPSTNIVGASRPILAGNNLNNVAVKTAAFPGLDPTAQKLFASGLYPKPNVSGRLLNNYTYTRRSQTNANQGDVRLDYAATPADHIFARVSKMYTGNPITNSWLLIPSTNADSWADSGIAGWTHIFKPWLLNDVRFGVNYTKNIDDSDMNDLGNLATQLGIVNGNSNYGHPVAGLPHINLGTYFTAIGSADVASLFADTSLQADDDVTMVRGQHVVHIGLNYRRYRINTFFSTESGEEGSMAYTGAFTALTAGVTGLGAADFVYGALANEDRGADSGTWGQRATNLAGYAQDDWRALSTLTINLGMRYDNHLPWVEVNDKAVNFDLHTGAPVYPQGQKQSAALNAVYGAYSPEVASNRATYNSTNLGWDFQPRVGFAYSPHILQDRFVLRGAVSATTYMEGTGTNLRITENPPFVYTYSLGFAGNNAISPNQTTSPTGAYYNTEYGFSAQVQPSLLGANLRVWDPNIKPAIDIMYNLTTQYQLSKHDSLQVGYVGQKSTHEMVPMNYAQWMQNAAGTVIPGPYLGEQKTFDTGTGLFQVPGAYNSNLQEAVAFGAASVGHSTYNSLQTVFQHRFDKNLEMQLSYTWSKCMADNVGYYGNASGQSQPQGYYRQDQYNPGAEWGPCYFNTPQIFTGYALYSLPFGKGQAFGNHLNKVLNGAVSNWQIGVVNTDHVGYALTAIDWRVYPVTWGNFINVTPRASCAGAVRYDRKIEAGGMRFWDSNEDTTLTPGFSSTAAGAYGSCRNGTIRGPGETNFDASLQKVFPLHNEINLQIRAEATNLFNHPLFQMPDTALSDGSEFGVASGANAAENERQIQFAVKLYF